MVAELLVTAAGIAAIAVAAMTAGSLSAVTNANRLRRFRPPALTGIERRRSGPG